MLPATNRGVGMNLGFPDVCLTPTPVGPVPIPYPNVAQHAMAVPFALTVMISGMNALNMGSRIPMTSGDEGGVAHPMVKQSGGYTMGNPMVLVEGLPGGNLLCPTNGNNFNAPVGAQLVPSAVNVLYTRFTAEIPPWNHTVDITPECVRAFGDAVAPGAGELTHALLPDAVGYIRLAAITHDAPSRLFSALRTLSELGARTLVLDLRGNPGGDLDAAVRITEVFLPAGALIATVRESDGDEWDHVSHNECPDARALTVLVDGDTASAAELIADALGVHRRAEIQGPRTRGKRSIQRILPGGGYATVAEVLAPSAQQLVAELP